MYTDYEGITRDMMSVFVEEEYKAFPVMAHDDMLDCLARIVDPELKAEFPKTEAYAARYATSHASGSRFADMRRGRR